MNEPARVSPREIRYFRRDCSIEMDSLRFTVGVSLSPSLYNSLPADIKQTDRLETFKHELKEYIPSRIKYI